MSFDLFFKSTDNMWGITSPALSTVTVSPILMSFLSISSSLCNVAFDTNTPPMLIGFIFSASSIWNPNLMFLQSFAWIIGAIISLITYYLLTKK